MSDEIKPNDPASASASGSADACVCRATPDSSQCGKPATWITTAMGYKLCDSCAELARKSHVYPVKYYPPNEKLRDRTVENQKP